MARLAATPYPGDWELHFEKGIDAECKRTDAMLKELYDKAVQIDPQGDLKGAVVRFQVADGYAVYIVVKDKPLTLQHVPIGDEYQISAAHMRGLRREDIIHQLRFNALFR